LKNTNAAKEKHQAAKKGVETAVDAFHRGDDGFQNVVGEQVNETAQSRPDKMQPDEENGAQGTAAPHSERRKVEAQHMSTEMGNQ
jgi:hypothetical protein